MIDFLRSLGIEPHATEQPLDLSIPENKMMLAFYLAVPEVENDRRALNVFHGMRRARKEGRWIASAPTGYVNRTAENGAKYIAPREPQAGIMKWAFTEIATGKYPVEQVWRAARKKGLAINRNNFYNLIRNPMYCGKIVIPAYKDEPTHWVLGQHEPLITEALFKRVQRVLKGKARRNLKIVSPEQLPLRGFLKCPACGKMLTGSASRGRNAYYHYYHCMASCRTRFKAEEVNRSFVGLLEGYALRTELKGLFRLVLRNVFEKQHAAGQQRRVFAQKQLDFHRQKIEKAKDLLLSSHLEPEDYRQLKTACEKEVTELEKLLATLPDAEAAVSAMFRKRRNAALNLSDLYENADVEQQRKLIGVLFLETLTYDGTGFETALFSRTFKLVFSKYLSKYN